MRLSANACGMKGLELQGDGLVLPHSGQMASRNEGERLFSSFGSHPLALARPRTSAEDFR